MSSTTQTADAAVDRQELRARSARARHAVAAAQVVRDADARALADAVADAADAETIADDVHQYALSRAAHAYAEAVFDAARDEAASAQ